MNFFKRDRDARKSEGEAEHTAAPSLSPAAKIGKKEIRQAAKVLEEYKQAKAGLDSHLIANEKWYKQQHWDEMRKISKNYDFNPASGWLFNIILSKHADAMDNYPEGNFLPHEADDEQEAKNLTSIIPCILKANRFKRTYDRCWWYKLKNGTACYSVTWDGKKHNGLGDVNISKVSLLKLFWEPGIENIQDSRNIFYINLIDNDLLEAQYPQVKGQLGNASVSTNYVYDNNVKTDNKSAVIDWYYKTTDESGKTILNYCKFVGETVLFSSVDAVDELGSPAYPDGWYDDGLYPFVFDVLYPEEDMPTGFGIIDTNKSPQEQIDRLNKAILKSAMIGSTPRYFFRRDCGINKDDFSDWTKDMIEVSASMSDDNIRPVPYQPLNGTYVSVLNNKIEEMKETSGNRDVANGGSTSGVTAASAIAALQEQSGKLSRDMIQASYGAFENLLTMVLERVRQFYSVERTFRIVGEQGQSEYIRWNNVGIRTQAASDDFGVSGGYRVPEFDIEVTAQKASAYSQMAQNELALQLYQLGVLAPENADTALALLKIMDFKHKEDIEQVVKRNGTLMDSLQAMQQQALKMAQIIDAQNGSDIAQELAAQLTGAPSPTTGPAQEAAPNTIRQDSLGAMQPKEHAVVTKARDQAANAAAPR